jgi:three-Cys-motif partner protein
MSDAEPVNSAMVNEPVGQFGGKWTLDKAEDVVKYAKAYLTIMRRYKFRTIYFDGFAGSGEVVMRDGRDAMESVALQVMAIEEPGSFDMYYLVELDPKRAERLRIVCAEKHPKKKVHVVSEDCNVKLKGFADFIRKHKGHRALAFLDPFGMQVSREALKVFKDVGVDMWILFPSAIGIGRMLQHDIRKIPARHWELMTNTLGMTREEIEKAFYTDHGTDLFGEPITKKLGGPTARVLDVYRTKLQDIWKHVSDAHELKNSIGMPMFHFILASQNPNAKKIAEDIIKRTSNG